MSYTNMLVVCFVISVVVHRKNGEGAIVAKTSR